MSRSSHRRQLYQDQLKVKILQSIQSIHKKEEQIPQMNDIPQPVNTQPVNNNALSREMYRTKHQSSQQVLYSQEIYSHRDHLIFEGTINGNVMCNGKIVVTGTVNGNTNSSEFFADVAKVEGEIVSTGTVKIGAGSVIIGNISASSAVIAGAVKGDIDVRDLL